MDTLFSFPVANPAPVHILPASVLFSNTVHVPEPKPEPEPVPELQPELERTRERGPEPGPGLPAAPGYPTPTLVPTPTTTLSAYPRRYRSTLTPSAARIQPNRLGP